MEGPVRSRDDKHSGARTTRGIMLVDSDAGPGDPEERRRLAAAVDRLGWVLSVRFGPSITIADLALADRNETSRESWGLPPRFDLVLLIARPTTVADRELVRALRQHASRTVIHRWTGTEIVPWSDEPESHEPGPSSRSGPGSERADRDRDEDGDRGRSGTAVDGDTGPGAGVRLRHRGASRPLAVPATRRGPAPTARPDDRRSDSASREADPGPRISADRGGGLRHSIAASHGAGRSSRAATRPHSFPERA